MLLREGEGGRGEEGREGGRGRNLRKEGELSLRDLEGGWSILVEAQCTLSSVRVCLRAFISCWLWLPW